VGRALILAYYFPPLVGPASERASSLTGHLLDLGWDPVVITPRDGFYHRAPLDEPSVKFPVIRTPSLEISRVLRRIYGGKRLSAKESGTIRPVKPRRSGRSGDTVRSLVRDFIYLPDAQVGWIPFAIASAISVLRHTRQPRIIYSTSVPYSAHLAAMAVSRLSGAAWVAELRDPWSTSTSPHRSRRRVRRRIDRTIERRIVYSADHIIVTSESTRQELLDAHPDLRPGGISVVTNGFEPVPERPSPPCDAPMTILYAGTVAAGEDMDPVLVALDEVHAHYPGRFRLRVLGPEEPWQTLTSGIDRPWLELSGVVSPARAREAMAESSVLLLVQRHPAYRTVLPGKLFEYIGARRPILAICPPESEMEALVRRHADVRLVRPSAPEELGSAVEQLLGEHSAGSIQGPRVPFSVTAQLRRSEQAAELASIFERLVQGVAEH